KRFSWLGLVLAVLIGVTSMLVLKRKAKRTAAAAEPTPAPAPVGD
ncbi:DedA family protein, partial [Streptomyces werraensis]